MRFLSLFSGIEAATLAWEPLGWEPMAYAEIEPFPSAVLAERWPDVPNLGDILAVDWEQWLADNGTPDVIVAGSPCQAFSVAGSRLSLEDARGNLTLFTAELVRLLNPGVFLWENVPGALSTKDNAFGCLLGELVGAGEALSPPGKRWTNAGLVSGPEATACWRVLDAQYFGVPQRRRRLFLARCPRDGADPAEVLLERESLFGDPAPSREARTRPAGSPAAGARGGDLLADTGVVRGLKARFGTSGSDLDDAEAGHLIASEKPDVYQCHGSNVDWPADVAATLQNGTPRYADQDLFSQQGANLVPDAGPWWDGSDTSETIDVSRVLKQQTMPDKARFAAVLEQTPWVKCESCDGFLCTVHGAHAHDCPCPVINVWAVYELNPYFPCDIGKVQEMLAQEGEQDPIGFYPTGGTHGVSAIDDCSPAVKVGSGLGIPSSPAVAFKPSHYTCGKDGAPSEVCPPLTKEADKGDQDPIILALASRTREGEKSVEWQEDLAYSLNSPGDGGRTDERMVLAPDGVAVMEPSVTAFAENVRGEVRDCGDLSTAVSSGGGKPGQGYPAVMVGGFRPGQSATSHNVSYEEDMAPTLEGGGGGNNRPALHSGMAVRRLTPVECERLQGMPDNHTRIPWRGKGADDCPDGPRYKAIGNSMAVPVIRWLGRRIATVLEEGP